MNEYRYLSPELAVDRYGSVAVWKAYWDARWIAESLPLASENVLMSIRFIGVIAEDIKVEFGGLSEVYPMLTYNHMLTTQNKNEIEYLARMNLYDICKEDK